MLGISHIIYKICNYIIKNKINDIVISDIISGSEYENELQSFDIKLRIFKKLVLYDYCYHYKLYNVKDSEILMINNYILNINNDLVIKQNLDINFLAFIDWCRLYNYRNTNTKTVKNHFINQINEPINKYSELATLKENYISSSKKIYFVSGNNKNITFQ